MPITYDIRSDLKLVIIIHTGSIPDEEFLSAYNQLSQDENFNITYNRLVDLRHADSRVRTTDALSRLARASEERHLGVSPRPKTAVITASDLTYGLSRMYYAISSNASRDFGVFKSLEQGLSWLNLPPDTLSDYD